jgi:hypothetical protein
VVRKSSAKQREAARRWCLENRPWERSSGRKPGPGKRGQHGTVSYMAAGRTLPMRFRI